MSPTLTIQCRELVVSERPCGSLRRGLLPHRLVWDMAVSLWPRLCFLLLPWPYSDQRMPGNAVLHRETRSSRSSLEQRLCLGETGDDTDNLLGMPMVGPSARRSTPKRNVSCMAHEPPERLRSRRAAHIAASLSYSATVSHIPSVPRDCGISLTPCRPSVLRSVRPLAEAAPVSSASSTASTSIVSRPCRGLSVTGPAGRLS